jgi:hypothetical protein
MRSPKPRHWPAALGYNFRNPESRIPNPKSQISNPGSKASRQPAARRQESATSPARFRQILAAMRFSSMAHGLLLMGIAR